MRMMFLVFVGLSFTAFDYAQSYKQSVVRQNQDGLSDSYGFYDLVGKIGNQSASLDDLDELGAFLDAKGLWIAPSSLAGSRILGNDPIVNFSQNAYETEAVLTDGIWFNPNDHDVFIDDEVLQESFKLPSLGVLIVSGSFEFTDVVPRITMVKGAARDGREFQDLMTWESNSVRIRNRSDWMAFLSAERGNENGLLSNLSDLDLKLFEQKLVFGDRGVSSLYVRILKTKCTFQQYEAILGLFGLTVEYSMRADYEDKECEKRATCTTRSGSICTSNC